MKSVKAPRDPVPSESAPRSEALFGLRAFAPASRSTIHSTARLPAGLLSCLVPALVVFDRTVPFYRRAFVPASQSRISVLAWAMSSMSLCNPTSLDVSQRLEQLDT